MKIQNVASWVTGLKADNFLTKVIQIQTLHNDQIQASHALSVGGLSPCLVSGARGPNEHAFPEEMDFLPNWLLDFTKSPSQFTPLGGYLWLAVLGLTCHCTQTSQRLARTSLPVGVSLGGPPAALSDGSKRRASGMCRTIALALGTSFVAGFQGLWKCCPRGECRREEFPRRCIIL